MNIHPTVEEWGGFKQRQARWGSVSGDLSARFTMVKNANLRQCDCSPRTSSKQVQVVPAPLVRQSGGHCLGFPPACQLPQGLFQVFISQAVDKRV